MHEAGVHQPVNFPEKKRCFYFEICLSNLTHLKFSLHPSLLPRPQPPKSRATRKRERRREEGKEGAFFAMRTNYGGREREERRERGGPRQIGQIAAWDEKRGEERRREKKRENNQHSPHAIPPKTSLLEMLFEKKGKNPKCPDQNRSSVANWEGGGLGNEEILWFAKEEKHASKRRGFRRMCTCVRVCVHAGTLSWEHN